MLEEKIDYSIETLDLEEDNDDFVYFTDFNKTEIIKLNIEQLRLFKLLNNLFDMDKSILNNSDNPIVIQQCKNSEMLKFINEYSKINKYEEHPKPEIPLRKDTLKELFVKEEYELFKPLYDDFIEGEKIIEYINFANYLNADNLLYKLCAILGLLLLENSETNDKIKKLKNKVDNSDLF